MKLKRNSSFLPLLFGIFFLTFETGVATKNQKYKHVYLSDDEYQKDDIAKDKAAEKKDRDIPSVDFNRPQGADNIAKTELGTEECTGPKLLLNNECGWNLVASHLIPKDDKKLSATHKNLNERKACEGESSKDDDEINIDKIYGMSPNEEAFGTLYDAEIFVNDFENYETFSETYELVTNTMVKRKQKMVPETGGPYTLLDIASEIAKLKTSRKDPELVKKLREALQKDLNDFLCKNPPKQRLPYGISLVFQDTDDDKLYGLVTSGFRKKWTLLKPDGEQVDGDVSIEISPKTRKEEIIFRCRKAHNLLKSTDWTFISPKARHHRRTTIKKIKTFKKHIGTSLEEIRKFKRAAYIEDQDGEWEPQGFYQIKSDEIEYDVSSTMYRIKWKDQSTKDTLKHESDLAGDIEIGDVVLFPQDIAEDIGFGCVTQKLANGYQVKPVDDLNEDTLFLPSEKIDLWEKRKPSDDETNVEHSEEDFSEVFFEQIADLLNDNDHSNFTANSIREIIANHVSEEEEFYLGVHPREFLTSDEISEVIKRVRQSSEKKNCKKPTNDIVKIEILNYWRNQMKKEKRRADNLSVFAAVKCFGSKVIVKVLGPKKNDERAQFLISLREIPTKTEIEEQKNELIPDGKEKNIETSLHSDEIENELKRKRDYHKE